jgi:hypothetical protein
MSSDVSQSPSSAASEELVTVGAFNEPADAGLAQSALEAAGIESMLRSANANSLLPFAFESELQVRSSDESAAREVLDSAFNAPPTEAEVAIAEESAAGDAKDA